MKLPITMMALSLTLIASSFNASADVQTKPFSYRVEVPAGTAGCQTHATSVADLFSKAVGVAVDSSTCSQETLTDNGATFTKDVIVINYQANYQANPFRAVFGGDVYMSTSTGYSPLFNTYSDCLNALDEQTKDFTTFTGLVAVASHCDSPADDTSTGFVLAVEGFGQPAARLYAFQNPNEVLGPTNSPEIQAAVRQIIVDNLGMISYSDASRIFYYGKQQVSIVMSEPGDFDVSTECTSQIDDAKAIYTAVGLKSVQAFCLANSDTSTVTGHLAIVGGGDAMVDSDYGQNSEHYTDFASCASDKARVIQNAISNGSKALGAICTPEGLNKEYRLNLYTQFL